MEIWVDGAGTHALPPAAVDTSAALYTVLGPRAVWHRPWGLMSLSGQYGLGVGVIDAGWWSGQAAVSGGWRLGGGMARVDASAHVLDYTTPFNYGVVATTLVPSYGATLGSFGYTAHGTIRLGRWQSDAPDTTGMGGMADPTRQVDGPLTIYGGGVRAGHALGPAWVTLEAEALEVTNGALDGGYWTGMVQARLPIRSVQLHLSGSVQDNPLETEWGYAATLGWPVTDGVVLQAAAGRTVTDPLYGTEGSFSASLGVAWRVGRRAMNAPVPFVRPGEWVEGGRRVEFHLRAPRASDVALAGDFTGWEPMAMERSDGGWLARVVLAPGVHHFGFIVDGEWTLPANAPGVVEDGWGRSNASVVIERRTP